MVENDSTKKEEKKDEKKVEKEQPKKEKDTLPIDTDQLDENNIQELNDGDEFEEFPIYEPPTNQTHSIDEAAMDLNVWEDNWEDETVEKDFALQLSEELGNKNILKQNV